MPPPYARGAQVRIVGAMHGSETNNVLNFATNIEVWDADTTRTRLEELATNVLQCVRDTLLPAVTSDWKLVRVEAKMIFGALSDPMIVTGLSTDVGARGPTSVSFATMIVNVRSGQGGRRGRGRIKLPPPGEADITSSDVDAAVMLLLAQFLLCIAGKYMGASKTEEWELGVLSRTDAGPTLANFDNGFREALSLNPVARLGVIRSRKAGIGS